MSRMGGTVRAWATAVVLGLAGSASSGGGVTNAAALPPGLYGFPDEAGLHHPWLLVATNGAFAFLSAPEEAAGPGPHANAGTCSASNGVTILLYQARECCQFADVEREPLAVLRTGPQSAVVRFREVERVVRRLPLPRTTGGAQ